MFRFSGDTASYDECIETAEAIDQNHCACFSGAHPSKVKKVTIGTSSMLVLEYDCESG